MAGGFRIELEPEPGYADTGDLETDLTELLVALGEGARAEGLGAALLIDELHEVPPEQLDALIGAAHRVNQERLPVVVGGAGLPPVGRVLSEARSYAERLFSIRPVGALTPEDTRSAFAEPAAELGIDVDPEALDELVALSGGYPFFIQTYGKHVWDVADDSPIAPDDVALATPRANRELVDSFFRPRYDRATPAERRYMHAMADIGNGPVSSAEVATRARPRPAGSGVAAARRAAHQGPDLRAGSWSAGVHRAAHGDLPPRAGGAPVTRQSSAVATDDATRSDRGDMTERRFRIGLLIITAIGAAWRLGYLIVAKLGEPLLLNDSLYFSIQAGRNSEGDWFREGLTSLPGAEHGPLTSLYLTPWSIGSGNNVGWQRFAMTLLGIATVAVIGLVGRRLGGARVGLVAAGIAAVYPNLWVNDSLVMSESLALLLVALALLVALDLDRRPALWRAALLGVIVGMATLTRSELGLLAVGFAGLAWWRAAGFPRRVLLGLLVLGTTVLTVVPWVAYNATQFDRTVLLSTNDGTTLLGANCDSTYYGDIGGWDITLPVAGAERGHHRRLGALGRAARHRRRLRP